MIVIDYGEYSGGGTDEPLGRYVLFSGMTYYPSNGVDDLRATSDNIEELREYVAKTDMWDGMKWWQICDRDTLRIIECGDKEDDES